MQRIGALALQPDSAARGRRDQLSRQIATLLWRASSDEESLPALFMADFFPPSPDLVEFSLDGPQVNVQLFGEFYVGKACQLASCNSSLNRAVETVEPHRELLLQLSCLLRRRAVMGNDVGKSRFGSSRELQLIDYLAVAALFRVNAAALLDCLS